MGLIKAGIAAIGSALADQWKEYFYCDSIDSNTLVVKGQKRTSKRSSNTNGSDNVITSGSGIAVADGQCMIIVEQGKVVELCAEPGEFTYDASTEPSIFTGDLGDAVMRTFQIIGKRFSYGGDTGMDQRVYYFNTKEIIENKFGTANPIPFRVVDHNIGLDIDVSIRCNGVYSYRIVNPLLFYSNVCGNVEREYRREEIDRQLKTEFISALQPSFAKISELQIRPNAIPGHVQELCNAMNDALTQKWSELRGLAIVSIAMNPITLSDEDAQLIKQAQRTGMIRNPAMAAATLTEAQAEAMKAAASNKSGAMMGFMGMGLANQAGGVDAHQLFQMGNSSPTKSSSVETWKCSCGSENTSKFCPSCGKPKPEPAETWTCSCGTVNTGKFCLECGKPKPSKGWTCSCGAVNLGKFCSECGKAKPSDAPLYRCDKCGWEAEDPYHPPKFCPECGDPFDENDRT